MTSLTPSQATETLRRVLALQAQGLTWRHIAAAMGLDSPQAAKKMAKEAARVSQNLLLRQGLDAQR